MFRRGARSEVGAPGPPGIAQARREHGAAIRAGAAGIVDLRRPFVRGLPGRDPGCADPPRQAVVEQRPQSRRGRAGRASREPARVAAGRWRGAGGRPVISDILRGRQGRIVLRCRMLGRNVITYNTQRQHRPVPLAVSAIRRRPARRARSFGPRPRRTASRSTSHQRRSTAGGGATRPCRIRGASRRRGQAPCGDRCARASQ